MKRSREYSLQNVSINCNDAGLSSTGCLVFFFNCFSKVVKKGRFNFFQTSVHAEVKTVVPRIMDYVFCKTSNF